MTKTSEIISNKTIFIDPYLHGCIFSRIIETKNNEYFVIPISFKKSKYDEWSELNNEKYKFINVLNSLNNFKNSEQWKLFKELNRKIELKNAKSPEICYLIKNDANITKDEFLKLIYFNILNQDYIKEDRLNENKRNFIRGFFESRGSIDFKAKYYSLDYYYEKYTTYDLKRVLIFFIYLSIPEDVLNINFRELQPDFIKNNKKRNTQIRINLDWYIKNIGLYFGYRINLIQKNYCNYFKISNNVTYFLNDIESRNSQVRISNRINLYYSKILNKELTNDEKIKIKNEILDLKIDENKINRNQKEVIRAKLSKPNYCFSCHNKYKLEDRTFLKKNSLDEYYLEIHHNIPFSNNRENLDIYENLVKLCPICHSALKKNRANEQTQKDIIKNIIEYDIDCKEFAISYFNLDKNDINLLINKIYESLL